MRAFRNIFLTESRRMALKSRMEQHRWDSEHDQQTVPLFLHLQWAQAASLDTMAPTLAKCALSEMEFDLLATLRNAPPPHRMTPSNIQQEMVITSGGLTKVLSQLEARGLISRTQQAEDLRVKPAALTEAGRELIEEAMAATVRDAAAWFRQRLDGDEMRQLQNLLEKLSR